MILNRFSSSILLLLTVAFLIPDASAVEVTQSLGNFSIVGVIAGGKKGTEVAVIRDNSANRSVTVSVGSHVGADASYLVTKIARRVVEVTKDGKKYSLEYVLPERLDANKTATGTASAATQHDSSLSSYLNEFQNVEDGSSPDQWSRDDLGYDTNASPYNLEAYPVLRRERRIPSGFPLILDRDVVDRPNSQTFNTSDESEDEFAGERKFREKYRQLRAPMIREIPENEDGENSENEEMQPLEN
jgi:hypothetical protein